MNSECIICKKQHSADFQFIYKSDQFVVSHFPTDESRPLLYKGHLFIEAARHITSYAQLNLSEANELGGLLQKSVRMLEKHLGAEHVYSYTIGHVAPHLHIHLVPRYKGTPEEFWDRKLYDWPEGPRVNQQEIKKLSIEMKNYFI